ncbi:MAG TPA: GspH/FimT family pseudopilin [Aromatoleum sp.]|uniref:GspH/FimT family pseudopilin n=1 Tax=Aromatoleum sp. TaxID=2307007 RepID=UPI002B49755F|nr:GspH/FimT family pseudopilin [Aromatoleum sp.]HJV25669.1 GspH/FimT family pseudopilin [Aromatoleum sp.]
MTLRQSKGFTLTETLIVVSILGVLIAVAQPTMQNLMDARRVTGAAEAIETILQTARSESVSQMRPMVVSYSMNGSVNWAVGLRDSSSCDPNVADLDASESCSLPIGDVRIRKIIDHLEYPGVTAHADRAFTKFEPLRATAHGSNVTVNIAGSSGKEIHVIVAPIGRVRSCSPTGSAHIPGFPVC